MISLKCVKVFSLMRWVQVSKEVQFSDLIVISIVISKSILYKDFSAFNLTMNSFFIWGPTTLCLVAVLSLGNIVCKRRSDVLYVWSKEKNHRQHRLHSWRHKGKKSELQKLKLHQKKIQKPPTGSCSLGSSSSELCQS